MHFKGDSILWEQGQSRIPKSLRVPKSANVDLYSHCTATDLSALYRYLLPCLPIGDIQIGDTQNASCSTELAMVHFAIGVEGVSTTHKPVSFLHS